MSNENLTEWVTELEERVARLEQELAERDETHTNNNEQAENPNSGANLDRYDRQVVDIIDDPVEEHPRKVMEAYETAGVLNKKKQKRRTKRLKKKLE